MVQMRMEGFKKLAGQEDLERLRVIEKDDTNSSVTTDSEESKQIHRTHRERLSHLVNSTKFQISIVCLVIFDVLLVITELLIDLRIFELHEASSVPQVLHYMSIGVLSIFLIEIAVKIYAMRLEFFKRKLEIFDSLIVIVTFALSVAFSTQEGIQSAVGLIIIFRLWRITRILNGIIMTIKVQSERRLFRERRGREAVEQELAKFREYCAAQEREIEILQGLLRKHGIAFDKVEKLPMVNTINVVAEVNEYDQHTNCLNEQREAEEHSGGGMA